MKIYVSVAFKKCGNVGFRPVLEANTNGILCTALSIKVQTPALKKPPDGLQTLGRASNHTEIHKKWKLFHDFWKSHQQQNVVMFSLGCRSPQS